MGKRYIVKLSKLYVSSSGQNIHRTENGVKPYKEYEINGVKNDKKVELPITYVETIGLESVKCFDPELFSELTAEFRLFT